MSSLELGVRFTVDVLAGVKALGSARTLCTPHLHGSFINYKHHSRTPYSYLSEALAAFDFCPVASHPLDLRPPVLTSRCMRQHLATGTVELYPIADRPLSSQNHRTR